MLRIGLLVATLAIATLGAGTEARAVCNIRGEHCGYPAWAANAFSNRWDRVPDWVLNDLERRRLRHYRAQRPHRR